MAEYIEREALAEHIKDLPTWWADGGGYYPGSMKYPDGMFCPEDVVASIENAAAADVAPVSDLKEFAEDVLYQFGYKINYNGGLHITAGGLSTLEWAFSILGWEDPHPFPEGECEWDGCHEYASCGTRTLDGYKRVCGKHYEDIKAREEAERNARMDGE